MINDGKKFYTTMVGMIPGRPQTFTQAKLDAIAWAAGNNGVVWVVEVQCIVAPSGGVDIQELT